MAYSRLKPSHPGPATTKTAAPGAGNNIFNADSTRKTPIIQDVGTETVLLMFQRKFGDDYMPVNHPGLPLSNNSWMLTMSKYHQHGAKNSGVLPSILTKVTGVIRENDAVYRGFRYLTSWSTSDLGWFYVILEKPVINKKNVAANEDCRADKLESDAKFDDSHPASDWDTQYVELETPLETRNPSHCHSSWEAWSPTPDTANVNDNTNMSGDVVSAIHEEWGARPPTPFEAASDSAAHNHNPSVTEEWATGDNDGGNEWDRQPVEVKREIDNADDWDIPHENEAQSERSFDKEWRNPSCIDDNASDDDDDDNSSDSGLSLFPNVSRRDTPNEYNEDCRSYLSNGVESYQGPRLVRKSSVGMPERDPVNDSSVYHPRGWKGICSPRPNPYLRAAANSSVTTGPSGPCKRLKRETHQRTVPPRNMGLWRTTNLTPTSNRRARPALLTPTTSWQDDYNTDKDNGVYSEWSDDYWAQPPSAGGCDVTSSLNVNTGHNCNYKFDGVGSNSEFGEIPMSVPKTEDTCGW